MIPMHVSAELKNVTGDYEALHGLRDFDSAHFESWQAVRFWMHYAWSAFCQQWIVISWCAVIGTDRTREAM